MSAPSVTTLSGRQAHIESTVQRQILANVSTSTSNTGNSGTTSTTGSGTVNQAQALPILTPQPVALPTGPTLDVIPYVSADGYTIQMTMIPSILDFLGYGNPDIADAAAYETSIKAVVGTATSTLPLPRIQIRQITTSAMVWDGQTVVLGGLISDNVMRKRDKVPFLGDIPGIGRLFRSESSTTSKKNLVVFVTARIIDPAGNKVHTDDNMPYDPGVMPVQKSAAATPAAK
jgi:general secretion pathway protein D